jgi:transposase
VQPRPIPGRPNVKAKALQAELARQLETHPGLTLAEHCQIWETEHGMRVSSTTMSRAMHAVGWIRTKRSMEQQSERVIEEEPLSTPKLFKQALQERWRGQF